jgi:hypothetical protein
LAKVVSTTGGWVITDQQHRTEEAQKLGHQRRNWMPMRGIIISYRVHLIRYLPVIIIIEEGGLGGKKL